MPSLESQDMLSFIYDSVSYPAVFDMFMGQFTNLDQADWVVVNTFYELEQEVILFCFVDDIEN